MGARFIRWFSELGIGDVPTVGGLEGREGRGSSPAPARSPVVRVPAPQTPAVR